MTSPPSLSAISLYQTLLAAKPALTSIHVSSKSFRLLLQGVFEFIRHRQIEATVWVKLPQRDVWQALLDEQIEQSLMPLRIYQLERLSAIAPTVSTQTQTNGHHRSPRAAHCTLPDRQAALDDHALVGDEGLISTTRALDSQCLTVPLVSTQHLNREYFVMVISAQFAGIFLAHRPRSVHDRAAAIDGGLTTPTEGLNALPASSDRPSRLLTLCAFRPDVLQATLSQLHQIVQASLTHQPNPAAELMHLLQTWPELVTRCQTANRDWDTIGHLFSHQVIQHELLINQLQRQDWHHQQLHHVEAENRQLQQTVQLKTEFLNRTSQALKPPITTMKTALKLLGATQLTDAQRQRYVGMLSQACDRQAAVLSGVVDLIQLEQIDPHDFPDPVYLHEIIPGLVSTYQPLANEHNITLAYTVSDQLLPVNCPAIWVQHIIMHLLQNSLHFTPQGGQVWVTAQVESDQAAPKVSFTVRDTGCGIDGADLPQVFDAFYRGRQATAMTTQLPGTVESGAGLGLTVVQQLLTRCQGTVQLKSQPGQGTIVTVTIPAHRQVAVPVQLTDPGH